MTVKNDSHEGQFLYLGRWIDKNTFRAFVYNDKGESRLATNYPEFENLTASGVWFPSRESVPVKIETIANDVSSKVEKPKNAIRSNS
jgi:hypothetical protein